MRHNALRTIYNATKAMTRQSGVKRIQDGVTNLNGALSLGNTMALFIK